MKQNNFFLSRPWTTYIHYCATLCKRSELTVLLLTIFNKNIKLKLLRFVLVDKMVLNVKSQVIMTGWTHNVPFLEIGHGTGKSNERSPWILCEPQNFFVLNIHLIMHNSV